MRSKIFSDRYPELAKEWHPTLNTYTAEEISYGSGKSVWWVCHYGHEYCQKINNRTAGNQGCPYCSGRKTLIGYNDLKTTHPTLASDWSLINDKPVTMFSAGSDYEAYWDVLSCGHTYKSRISRRVAGHGCSVCSGHTVTAGVNDLHHFDPSIAAEWDFSKNTMRPDEILFRSSKVCNWLCSKCKNSWSTSVRSRVILGTGCPKCVIQNTPRVVQKISDMFLNSEVNRRLDHVRWPSGQRVEVDILCKSTVIEYDGDRWHVGKEPTDIRKTQLLINNGYTVYRLREGKCGFLDFKHDNFIQIPVKWTLDSKYWNARLRDIEIKNSGNE